MPATPIYDPRNIDLAAEYITYQLNRRANGVYVNDRAVPGVIKVVNTPITITLQTTRMPGRRANNNFTGISHLARPRSMSGAIAVDAVDNDPSTIKRLLVELHYPVGMTIPPHSMDSNGNRISARFHFYINLTGECNYLSLHTRIAGGAQLYAKLTRQIAVKAETEAKMQLILQEAKKMTDEKRQKRMAQAEKREEFYTNMFASIEKLGAIDSKLEGEYVNITLPNKVKVRVDADYTGISVSEITIPSAMDVSDVNQIVEYINKLARI